MTHNGTTSLDRNEVASCHALICDLFVTWPFRRIGSTVEVLGLTFSHFHILIIRVIETILSCQGRFGSHNLTFLYTITATRLFLPAKSLCPTPETLDGIVNLNSYVYHLLGWVWRSPYRWHGSHFYELYSKLKRVWINIRLVLLLPGLTENKLRAYFRKTAKIFYESLTLKISPGLIFGFRTLSENRPTRK